VAGVMARLPRLSALSSSAEIFCAKLVSYGSVSG
jgi:hypothetical protein